MTEGVFGDAEMRAGFVEAHHLALIHILFGLLSLATRYRLRREWNNNTSEEGKAMKGDSFSLVLVENKACILFPQCAPHYGMARDLHCCP